MNRYIQSGEGVVLFRHIWGEIPPHEIKIVSHFARSVSILLHCGRRSRALGQNIKICFDWSQNQAVFKLALLERFILNNALQTEVCAFDRSIIRVHPDIRYLNTACRNFIADFFNSHSLSYFVPSFSIVRSKFTHIVNTSKTAVAAVSTTTTTTTRKGC